MEPERQIEKLLRAVAKKRRDQAGDALELRPAAREQLHQEISRRTASKSGGGFFGFFSSLFTGFTPKLAFGLCVLAVVGLGVWFLLPVGRRPQPSTLAMNEDSLGKAAPAARREIAAPPPPSSAAPVVAEENPNSAPAAQMSPPGSPAAVTRNKASSAPAPQMSLQGEAGGNRKHSVAATDTFKQPATAPGSIAQTSPAPATQAASVPAENAPSAFFDATPPSGSLAGAPNLDKDATSRTVGVVPPMVATNGLVLGQTIAAAEPEAQKKLGAPQTQAFYRANEAAVSDGLASFAAPAASNSQRYRQTVPARSPHAAATSSPSPVLTSFQVVQNGQQIRVVDADGSVYTGSFTTPEQIPAPAAKSGSSRFAPAATAPAAASAAEAEMPKQPAQNYFFRVAGTNLNLHQNVVFSGDLIPLANIPPAQTSAASAGGGGGAGSATPETSLLLNSRITGKAIIGGKKEIEVNATPAP